MAIGKTKRFEKVTQAMSESERFWMRVNKTEGCWLWTGAPIGNNGYGALRINGKKTKAHRYSWELKTGCLVPLGMVVMHTCDTPLCVNPDHLVVGTQSDNVRDRDRKGRTNNPVGSKHRMAKLTDEQVREIRSLYPGLLLAELSKRYGVSQTMISNIVRRKNWTNVE